MHRHRLLITLFAFVLNASVDAQDAAPADADTATPAKPDSQEVPNSYAPGSPQGSPVRSTNSNTDQSVLIQLPADKKLADAIRKLAAAINANLVKDLQHVAGTFEAELRFNTSTDYKIIETLIRDLQGMGVTRFKFARPIYDEDFVLLIAPPDVPFLKVRELAEYLAEQKDLEFDVRVRGNDDPPTSTFATPTPVFPVPPPNAASRAPQPFADFEQKRKSKLKVFYLKHVDPGDATLIINQLFDGKIDSIVSDPRTKALIVRADEATTKEIADLIQVLDSPAPQISSPELRTRKETARQDSGGGEPENGGERPAKAAPQTGDEYSASEPGPVPLALDFAVHAAAPGNDERVFSFYIGHQRGLSAEALRKQYSGLEGRAETLAREVHALLEKADVAPGEAKNLRTELRRTIEQSFHARQKLQRAELAAFAQRLQRIQNSIAMRDRIVDQIVDRRVEELLDPNVKWKNDNEQKATTKSTSSSRQEEEFGKSRNSPRSPSDGAQPLGDRRQRQCKITASRRFAMSWEAGRVGELSRTPTSAEFPIIEGTSAVLVLHSISGQHGLRVTTQIELPADGGNSWEVSIPDKFELQVTDEDLTHLSAGGKIQKVMCLTADGKLMTTVSSKLDPAVDSVETAKRRGRVVAVIRMTGMNWSPWPVKKSVELHGTWKMVSAYMVPPHNPNLVQDFPRAKLGVLSIQDNLWKESTPGVDSRKMQAAYSFDTWPQRVKLVDMKADGSERVVSQIFELDGDKLTTAMLMTPVSQYPESFDATNILVREYKRIEQPADSVKPSAVRSAAKKNFQTEGEQHALRVSFDDLDLQTQLNMDPVPVDAVDHFPDWLARLNGRRVRLRGHMYPTFTATGIRKFGLARDNEICRLERQPKIYEMFEVELAEGVTTDYVDNKPIDVEGVFRIAAEVEGTELFKLFRIEDARVLRASNDERVYTNGKADQRTDTPLRQFPLPESISDQAIVHISIPTKNESLGAEHTGLVVSKTGLVVTKLPKFGVGGDAMVRLGIGVHLVAKLVKTDENRQLCLFRLQGDDDATNRILEDMPCYDLNVLTPSTNESVVHAAFRDKDATSNIIHSGPPSHTSSIEDANFWHDPKLKGSVTMHEPTPGALLVTEDGLHGMVVALRLPTAKGDDGWNHYPIEAVSAAQLGNFVGSDGRDSNRLFDLPELRLNLKPESATDVTELPANLKLKVTWNEVVKRTSRHGRHS